jgi:hypothetical protein
MRLRLPSEGVWPIGCPPVDGALGEGKAMKRTSMLVAASALVLAMTQWSGAARTPTALADQPFRTTADPMLKALVPGVDIVPLITAGDVVGGRLGGFQFTGVPDGIGTYTSSPNRLEVFMNHELSHRYGDPAWSRVSHLTLNGQGGVVAASYALDGTERYEYFCSSTMDTIDGVPWYFTGEEWIGSPRGGMSVAINALTGRVLETPQFGALNHENVVPLKGMAKAAMYLAEDSFRLRSQAYSYFADDFSKALKGRGSFTVWVPDDQGDGDPSADDIAKGESLTGRFVTIPNVERYDGHELNDEAEALGSFNFVRIEDAATDPSHPGVVYFADTGQNIAETRYGRVYRMTYDVDHPRRATLEVVLDSTVDDIVNPDGMGINATSLVIQEDRNKPSTGFNRVHVYDLSSGTLTAIARTTPSRPAIRRAGGKGAWESSGAVDVSAFFGPGTWLMDVQAHQTSILQQGIDLKIDSAKGQRGQLLLVTIPGT